MTTFKKVSQEEFLQAQEAARKGRVSYPLIKGFLDTGYHIAEIEPPEGKKAANLVLLLRAYVNTHDLPINVIRKRTKLYFVRLDIDEEGNEVPNWREEYRVSEEAEEIGTLPITSDDV